jgi:CheY-like chemotaxis protein
MSIDIEIREKIINCFLYLRDGVERQTLARDSFIEKMVEAEFSEWNDIFLYVVNSLKEGSNEFKFPAAKMQSHIQSIAEYIEKVEDKSGIIDKVRNLPPVWIEKILIVDDMPIVAKIVKNMLKCEGDIDIAENGKNALELIDKKFYKLVISDIDMPVMDGMALFEEAVRRYPKLKNRFLFMTGDLSPGRKSFCNHTNVKCLEKPISVNRLREEAKKIILS